MGVIRAGMRDRHGAGEHEPCSPVGVMLRPFGFVVTRQAGDPCRSWNDRGGHHAVHGIALEPAARPCSPVKVMFVRRPRGDGRRGRAGAGTIGSGRKRSRRGRSAGPRHSTPIVTPRRVDYSYSCPVLAPGAVGLRKRAGSHPFGSHALSITDPLDIAGRVPKVAVPREGLDDGHFVRRPRAAGPRSGLPGPWMVAWRLTDAAPRRRGAPRRGDADRRHLPRVRRRGATSGTTSRGGVAAARGAARSSASPRRARRHRPGAAPPALDGPT